jgi:hypothetical protein
MAADKICVTIIYFIISLLGLLAWRFISKHLSGDNFSVSGFWACYVGVVIWGAAQWGVFSKGSILFFSPPLDFLVHNEWVRWIAFISTLLQTRCIPSKI